jgi:hypothetical protein
MIMRRGVGVVGAAATTTLVLIGVVCGAPGSAAAAASQSGLNSIQEENSLPGTSEGVVPVAATGRSIEGYASEVSALPGDTLHFHVSTNPAAPYRVEVYRLGWYAGAGARLIGCSPSCGGTNMGQPQPIPAPDSGAPLRAGWPVTDTFVLPPSATSGYYRVRFVLLDGESAATFVIVRAPPGVVSQILVQVPVNTWQAYNGWDGQSLYNQAGGVQQANRVSFDRPYWPAWQNPPDWEYPFVLFLERAGYDVSYQTDFDTDQNPSSLLGHRLVVDLGHDEYWTSTMRQAFEAARDAGVNLAFMGANDVYWRMRYEDGGRTVVVYKSRSNPDPITDPSQTTGMFRVVDRLECQLVGIQHQGGALNWPPGDYAVVPSSLGHTWFRGTGFDATSVLQGLVSVETDTIPAWDQGASCGHALTVFFQHNAGADTLGNADAVAYTAPSGATVFAAGSEQFVWGLADPPAISGLDHNLVDPRLQRFVTNMLDDLTGQNHCNLQLVLKATRPPSKGMPFKVRVVITNRGPDLAPETQLDLALAPGLAAIRVAGAGLRCSLVPVSCALGDLGPGASETAVFTLRAGSSGANTLTARTFSPWATNTNPQTATRRLAIQSKVAGGRIARPVRARRIAR